ncbi:MAG: restriction endonuclease subunit S [Gammaproteobacteria bacterium]
MNEIVLNELPKDWEWSKLGDVVTKIIGGGTPSKTNSEYWDGDIPWLTVKDMRTRRPADAKDHISEQGVEESSTNVIPEDTVIIATRIGLGKVIRVPYKTAINQDLKALVVPDEIEKGYLEYWFVSKKSYLESIGSGTTVKGIRLEQVRDLDFPLAPPEQQKRIVAKIEELFSHINAGIEALKKTKQLLKQYRQSVLKAAVTGEITKEWREAKKAKLESESDVHGSTNAAVAGSEGAAQLLKRILKERRQKWEEQQLEQFKSKGKMPKDDKWKGKYKEPETAEPLPFDIPDGWMAISLDTLLLKIQAGKSFKCDERPPLEGETGIVKVSAVTWGEFDSEESKTITDKEKINPDYRIREGDFLFSRANTISLVGACVIVKKVDKDLLLSDKIHRFVLPDELKEWVMLCLRTRYGRNEIESLATGNQESMRNISQGSVKKIRIPLLPLAELKEVIICVNQKIDGLQRLESKIEIQLVKAKKNKQSILASAFFGELANGK